MIVAEKGQKYWAPALEKAGFIAAFENHAHHRKFTYKLKNGIVSEEGVRYIGEGSWGVREGKCLDNWVHPDISLFQDYDNGDPNHVWKMTLKKITPTEHEI